FPVTYLASHCDGSAAVKLWVAMQAYARFAALMARGEVGLLHAHVASRASFWRKSFFFLLAFLCRVPAVLHLHGGEFRLFYERECGPLQKRLIAAVFQRCARVVVLSNGWRDWVRTIAPQQRVDVIANPVRVMGSGDTVRSANHVLFLGRLNRGKGS